jgi:hypothetical protein
MNMNLYNKQPMSRKIPKHISSFSLGFITLPAPKVIKSRYIVVWRLSDSKERIKPCFLMNGVSSNDRH